MKFHNLQKLTNITFQDKMKNRIDYKYLPIDSVGIYVPGSSASYPSSVLMAAIPGIVAKVKRLVMINPAFKGKQNPAVLYAAKKCKIKEIYSIGGPSAIAAFAYGTKKIKKVDKIVGPGNAYVAAAKKECFGEVGIESGIIGPSEILIICDKFSNPKWIASDLISQAEHDILAQCILISKDKKIIKNVQLEISQTIKRNTQSFCCKKSLSNNGIIIYANSDKKIIEICNKIGPEHLQIFNKNYKSLISKIKNASSICLGKYALMSMTDYGVPGSNHILPTNTSSRYSSGLSVHDFVKNILYKTFKKRY